MADAAQYREDAAEVRGAQKQQKRQSGSIAYDYLFKDNGENLRALIYGGIIGSYVTNYTGAWSFNSIFGQLKGIELGGFGEVFDKVF